MTLKYFQFLFLLSSLTITCSGQRIEKLNQIKSSDFSLDDQTYSKIIQQFLFVTFPFTLRPAKFGAQDDQFKLKYETTVRLKINEESKDYILRAGPYSEGAEIDIQSIIKYTIEKQKIKENKLKRDEIDINVRDSTFILDFSRITQGTSIIVDIKYSISTNNKGKIIALLDYNKIYNNYVLKLEIPEVYSFEITNIIDELKLNSKSNKNGEIIGYRNFDLQQPYLSTALKEFYLNNNPNSKVNFQPIYFKINISSYFLPLIMPSPAEERKEILNLRLLKINEMK